ncbi:hypothetical protein BDR03DRAFT_817501, partial [Suillus americanus]
CVTGLTIHHVGEHFQCLNNTISRYEKTISSDVIFTRCLTYLHLILFVTNTYAFLLTIIPSPPKCWPYSKDTIGALDGSHIHTFPPSAECHIYHNRK